MTEDIKLLVLV